MKARFVLTGVLSIFMGASGFFGIRYLMDNQAEAEPPPPAVQPLGTPIPGGDDAPKAPPLEIIEADSKAKRFVGEIQGVFIAPPDVSPPAGFLNYEGFCGSEKVPTEAAPWDLAGQLTLSVQLPSDFVFQPDSMNTGVIACAGKVYAARWDYKVSLPNSGQGRLTIVRSLLSHIPKDVSANRVKTVEVGGRQAVLVEPLTPDGISSAAAIIFPEQFGVTEIQSAGIPLTQLLEVAELVAGPTVE